MPAGLQCWTAWGALSFDTSDRITKYLGQFQVVFPYIYGAGQPGTLQRDFGNGYSSAYSGAASIVNVQVIPGGEGTNGGQNFYQPGINWSSMFSIETYDGFVRISENSGGAWEAVPQCVITYDLFSY